MAFVSLIKKRKVKSVAIIMSTIEKNQELLHAARDGRIDDVKKCLNDENVEVNGKCCSGWTALHYACWTKRHDIVELLLDHGADTESRLSNNDTPLMVACWHNQASITKLLLERGSKVNVDHFDGKTALHYACTSTGGDKRDSQKCVEELLLHGADTTVKDNGGKTPLHVAIRGKYQPIIDLLTEHINRTQKAQGLECVLASSSEQKLSSKVETIIDRRCEELRNDMIASNWEEMNRSFKELTSQITLSNAEVAKCVSNLSTIVGHLSSKVTKIDVLIPMKIVDVKNCCAIR
jgi:ankyrin repeat protein